MQTNNHCISFLANSQHQIKKCLETILLVLSLCYNINMGLFDSGLILQENSRSPLFPFWWEKRDIIHQPSKHWLSKTQIAVFEGAYIAHFAYSNSFYKTCMRCCYQVVHIWHQFMNFIRFLLVFILLHHQAVLEMKIISGIGKQFHGIFSCLFVHSL